jgi:hypothetical protein
MGELRAADMLSRETVEALRLHGIAAVRDKLKPTTARVPDLEAKVAEMRAALPPGIPDTMELVKSEMEIDGPVTVTKLVYRYRSAGGVAEVETWIENDRGRRSVETLRVVQQE